jgi:hypothetical protein
MKIKKNWIINIIVLIKLIINFSNFFFIETKFKKSLFYFYFNIIYFLIKKNNFNFFINKFKKNENLISL